SDNDDSLVSHFISLIKKGNLVEIVDPQVMEENNIEVQEGAALAAMCTRLKGEERPTMREVEMALENLQARRKPAPHCTSSERYDVDQIAGHYNSVEDLLGKKDLPIEVDIEEASRQYTMEEELLLSASSTQESVVNFHEVKCPSNLQLQRHMQQCVTLELPFKVEKSRIQVQSQHMLRKQLKMAVPAANGDLDVPESVGLSAPKGFRLWSKSKAQ
ncbi:hypothetical protein BAE44_0016253, partial [Dichanthelium oligosanthes]